MNIEELFAFLINDYGFKYKFQVFENCYDCGWVVKTYSFLNDNGCFTIHTLPQRGEIDFYISSKFSTNRKLLCEKSVDVRSIHPEIWNKYCKIGFLHKPFFWDREKKVFPVLAEVLKEHLNNHDDLFGIPLIH